MQSGKKRGQEDGGNSIRRAERETAARGRRLKRLGLHNRRRAAALCLTVATAVLVSTFFDPQLEGAQVAALLWTVFGIGVAVTSRSGWFDAAPRGPAAEVPGAEEHR